MPRSRKLTWQAGTAGRTGRWRKKYRGRSYYFSGGRGKTDQIAYEYAVQAWEKKRLEVDAATPNPDLNWSADPLQIEKAVWSDRLNVLQRSDEPHEADLQSHINRFLEAKRATVSAGRANMLRLHLNRFSEWCGNGMDVTELAGKTLAEYHQDLTEQARAKSLASPTAKECLSSVKTFIRWLWQRDVIPSLPRIMDGRTQQLNIPVDNNEIVVFTISEIKSLLSKASQRTKLYILLMLNCGMTQKDIADLIHSEVDWKTKQIVRRRSKTKSHVTVPIVRYRLWEETFALLLAERSNGNEEKVLLNTNGKPLWQETVDESGKYAKIDNIKSAYSRLCKQAATSKPLKSLKKTSATLIRGNQKYTSLESLFLGHAPQSMSDRHYAVAPQALLDEAIVWLGGEYGLE